MAAQTELDRREATWYQVGCLIDLELPEATRGPESLRSTLIRSDPDDLLRSAGVGLAYQFKLGSPRSGRGGPSVRAVGCSARIRLLRASFQSIYGFGLCASLPAMTKRWRLPTRSSSSLELFGSTSRCRTHAVRPLWHKPVVGAGLQPRRTSRRRSRAARAGQNDYAEHVCSRRQYSNSCSAGKARECACAERPESLQLQRLQPEPRFSDREHWRLHLQPACVRRRRLVDEIRGLSRAIEPTALISAVDAIVALKSGSRDVS